MTQSNSQQLATVIEIMVNLGQSFGPELIARCGPQSRANTASGPAMSKSLYAAGQASPKAGWAAKVDSDAKGLAGVDTSRDG